jgi:NAD(P)-dependent dehydrogenase (short-subunit alcohol dehydrogenase family)
MITRRAKPLSLEPDPAAPADAADLASTSAPMLRGLLAWPTGNEDRPYLRSVLEWRAGATVDQFLRSRKAHALAEAGPLTSDHLIRTKPWPMFVERPNWEAPELLRAQLKDAVESYRDRYRAYVIEHGGSMEGIVPSPTVVLLPGAGVFCWGRTKGEARIAADITEQTLAAKLKAQQIGTYQALAPEHLFAMEYRSQQRAKLATSTDRTLDGQVVVISGGAGAIGAAVAETCAEAGAHVVVTDLDEERLKLVTQRVEQRCGRYAASGIVMDVTDESSVRRGFEEICRWYGGVDVVVPNAGIAHVAPIEELVLEDFRRVMDVNVSGYLLFMREGIRILKQQGLGGHIVINASKNVFGPGKDFGAYSASKAAGHQLGKVAAIELAPYDIRVNMINADAVFGDEAIRSGLWAEVGPQRAKSRDMKTEDLPEYYRSRNLLKARVYGHHVGNAVVFFASNATPTTGATLPVDGGVVEAFPR